MTIFLIMSVEIFMSLINIQNNGPPLQILVIITILHTKIHLIILINLLNIPNSFSIPIPILITPKLDSILFINIPNIFNIIQLKLCPNLSNALLVPILGIFILLISKTLIFFSKSFYPPTINPLCCLLLIIISQRSNFS